MPTRQQFLASFKFDPEAKQDFVDIAGKPAQWVTGNPKQWGDENDSFQIGDSITKSGNDYNGLESALSPDQKLIAVSTGLVKTGVYDVATHELRAELEGMVTCWKPATLNGDGVDNDEALVGRPAYTLLTSVSNEFSHRHFRGDTLVFWDLDKNGTVLDAEEDIDAASFATKAIESILPELETKHEWTREFVDSSILHSQFTRVLTEIGAVHRRRHNTTIHDARITGFNSNPFTADGKKIVCLTHDETLKLSTTDGISTREKIVVYDIEANKSLFSYTGFAENVMWTGFSPNDQYLAVVAWDGKLRMYSAVTGAHVYSIGDTDRQAWSASFSPDSRFIVWSSQCGQVVQVHSVADRTLLSTFPSDSVKLRDWCRDLSWHPSGEKILLSVDQRVFIWKPFDSPPTAKDDGSGTGTGVVSGTILQTYEVRGDKSRFFDITSAQYLDEGRKVAICSSEGTTFVWDERTNTKALFGRPDGLEVRWAQRNLHYVGKGGENGEDVFVSADGDAKIRYWNVGFGALEDATKEVEEAEQRPEEEGLTEVVQERTAGVEKANVGVNSREPSATVNEGARDIWAERGAELWTAE